MKHYRIWQYLLLSSLAPLGFGCGSCSGRPHLEPDGGSSGGGSIAGLAIKGRIVGATVRVLRLNGTLRGAEVASATTGPDGAFSVSTGASEGPFILVVSAGSFRDEASAANINLNSEELTALIPSFSVGASVSNLLVTPVSHLAAGLALRYARVEGKSLSVANDEAWLHLNGHFGTLDWRQIVPTDLTSASGTQLDEPAKAGLVIAGLSQEALVIAQNAGLTGGGAVQSLSLTEALYDDLTADGFLDGVGASGAIVLPPGGLVNPTPPTAYKLDGQTARFTLAQGIARFLQSDKKTYGLTVPDVNPLLNAISSNSDSRIFRASDPGHAFYNAPPAVTFVAKFTGSDGQLHDPYGPARFVSGVVTITADAAGASGVKSLSLSVNGSPVPPRSQGNTASHYVGTWDTTLDADGPVTFVAHAIDLYENAGDTTFTLQIDNTKPSVTPSSPAAGFYSTSINLDAQAADPGGMAASGLASFVVNGLSSFSHGTDSAVSHVLGTWSIPSAQTDGALPISYVACDNVTNCSSVALPLVVDRTPPTVQLVAGVMVPQYTRDSTLALSVSTDDGPTGAGVSAVHAQLQGQSAILDAALVDGKWTFASIPLNEGPNTIKLWAEDLSSPANSGASRAAPYSLTLSSFKDSQPPAPTLQAAQSYYDERTMRVAVNGDGIPVIPAQYYWPSGTVKTTAVPSIWKSDTRLSWGPSAPTATELESTNAYNTPFLQVAVPFNPATDSPITTAKYCAGETCDLPLLFSHEAGGQRFYDAPISASNVPALASPTTSPINVVVTFTFADAAGNSSPAAIIQRLSFNVVGSPIQVALDTSYGSWDSKSVFAYPMGGGNLGPLWDTSSGAFPAGYDVRYQRYVLRNPAPQPVLVTTAVLGTWSAAESWVDQVWYLGPPTGSNGLPDYSQRARVTFADGLREYQNVNQWGTSGIACAQDLMYGVTGCNDSRRQYPYYNGPGCTNPDPEFRAQLCCTELDTPYPGGGGTSTNSPGSGAIGVQVFNSDGVTATPTAGAAPVRFVIPAATASRPGELNIYVTRPQVDRSPHYDFRNLGNGPNYQNWQMDYFQRDFGFQCCLGGCAQFELWRFSKQMTGNTESVSGTLTIQTAPNAGSLTAFGTAITQPGASTVSVLVTH